jgi:type IV pilus assembly protein PilC
VVFRDGLAAAVPSLLVSLALVGIIVALGWWACTTSGGKMLLRRLPLIGALLRKLAWQRFAQVLHISLLAARKPSDAFRLAGQAADDPVLAAEADRIAALLQAGNPLGPQVTASKVFPSDFSTSLATAEEAGTLETEAERWSQWFRAEANLLAERVAEWVPRGIYLIIVGIVAVLIVRMWTGYFEHLGGMMQ